MSEYNVELPVDEANQIEEASAQKMPVGDEAQSVAATDKASQATSKAPARKGDSTKQDPAPKTKAGMLNAMYSKLSGMKKDQLHAMYSKMEGFEVDEDGEAIELPEFTYTDELDALVESEVTSSA